ncbi:MAG: hypothetical protein ACK4P4_03455 [Allorhizobium sp.]
MRAILHIGTEKTGTTSFQEFCHKNRKLLLEQKVLYPTNLGVRNHRELAIYALDLANDDDGLRHLRLKSEDDLQEFRDGVQRKLEMQVSQASNADVCIISSEHFHSRLEQPHEIERVKVLLDPLFDEIEVHLHLRPQIDVVVSLASTQTRVGGAVRRSFFDRPKPTQLYFNYNLLVKAWEDVFSASNVHLLAFRKTSNFLGFIESHLSLDFGNMPVPSRVNEAIDVRVMAMVNALVDSGSQQRIDHRVIDLLPVVEKVRPDLKMAKAVQDRFTRSNQELVARRMDLYDGDLMPSWDSYSETGNLDYLDMPCAFSRPLADLITYYNTIITHEKAK